MAAPILSSNSSSLIGTGPGATVNPLTPVSNYLGLDGIHTAPSEVGQWSGGARKRKREASVGQVQQSPFGSPAARNSNQISSSDGGGYMSDSPPAAYRPQRIQQRREQTHSGSFLDRSGHETDQTSPSVVRSRLGPLDGCSSDRKMSSLLQPPPAPMEGSQCTR
jgi:hypothetical protein